MFDRSELIKYSFWLYKKDRAALNDSWGNCHREWEDNRFVYYISISDEFETEKISIKELESTICHEIIHTCNGCFQHGKRWVKYALRMDAEYGYEIATDKNEYNVFHSELPVLHQMVCPNCGRKIIIKKDSVWTLVQNGEKAYCAWCRHEMVVEF